MRVDFYHLTATPLDRVLAQLAGRIVAAGERLLVVATEADERARIDRSLWSAGGHDGFLPHGQAGGEHDARQPVLIAADATPANAATNVALADGLWREEALGFDRAFHLFDDARIGEARATWKALAGREGVERHYWKQDDAGKWTSLAG